MAKKGGMGLTDFFSILAFALILIIFYLAVKIGLGSATFELTIESTNVENKASLLGILRTPVIVDNKEITIAELIALSIQDSTKKELLEKTLRQTMDSSLGTSRCNFICINGNVISGVGCGFVEYPICSENTITIPNYYGAPINVYFESILFPANIQY